MVIIRDHGAPGASEWQRHEIPPEGLSLRLRDGRLALSTGREPGAVAWLVVQPQDAGREAVLIAPEPGALRVNGVSPLRVSILEERGEIGLGGERLYLSGRDPLVVARSDAPGSCRVCNDPTEGAECVTCAQCGAVAHEGPLADGVERRCFSHAGRCSGCGLVALDFAWTPDGDGHA